MRKQIIVLALGLCASPAYAEQWVTVFDSEELEIYAMVDRDSIRRGSDGLIYFTADSSDKSDEAADCRSRTLYTLKIHVHGGMEIPNWRAEGRAVVPGSAGEAILNYVCANA
jgi:hypothetical protein